MSYQQKIIKEYESKGFLVIKTIRLNKSGFPDLMCLKDGKTVWIEIKEPTDTLKPLQKKRIDELIKIGFEAYCLKKKQRKNIPMKTKILNYDLIDNIEVDGIDTNDYPDFCDAFIVSADYDGQPMSEAQIDELNEDSSFLHDCVYNQLF